MILYQGVDGRLYYATEEDSTQLCTMEMSSSDTLGMQWCFDDAYLYQWKTGGSTITIRDHEGTVLSDVEVEGTVQDCLRIDHLLYITTSTQSGAGRLITYDMTEKKQNSVNELNDFYLCLAAGEDGVLYGMNQTGVGKVDQKSGKANYYILWGDTAFTQMTSITGIQVQSQDQVQVITSQNASYTFSRMANPENGKTVITYRTYRMPEGFENAVTEFNKINEKYYLKVEQPSENETTEDFIRKLVLEISAGYGPDLVDSRMMDEMGSVYSNREWLMDLTSFLETIDTTQYIDSFADQWHFEDGIYGVGIKTWFINPVYSELFHELTQYNVEQDWTYLKSTYPNGLVLETEFLTQEQADALEQYMAEATCVRENRHPQICEIIYEEAEDYFDGMKTVEEVSAIIQNRVQLYLDENYS